MDGQAGRISRGRGIATRIGPVAAIALAGLAARTPLAEAYPTTAALLFLWIAADTMMLSLVARTAPGRPPFAAIVAVLATASLTVWVGSPAALRAALRSMPWLTGGMAAAGLLHITLTAHSGRHILRDTRQRRRDRWIAVAGMVVPPTLVRLAMTEVTILHMALFRWGGPPDMPEGARAFTYHRHLAPICAVLLVLSVIEAAVYHLLLAHWSGTAALLLFVVSDVGLVYLVGLIKSFRFRPVLITGDGLIVRAGFLMDHFIPFDAITRVDSAFDGSQVRDAATLNAALLAWPNIMITLTDARLRQTFRPGRRYSAIAFRLDDPESFLRLLHWRLGHSPQP